jgi:hypothetical protein
MAMIFLFLCMAGSLDYMTDMVIPERQETNELSLTIATKLLL